MKSIRSVWTTQELEKLQPSKHTVPYLYKHQLYPQRSGDIVCQTSPYYLFSKHLKGTSHNSPYSYDTHVPLIVYRKNHHENKRITSKVWSPQVPVTLAHLLQVPRPRGATYDVLPGLDE